MRLTRLGGLIILASALAFLGALISANNLLYLIFSFLVSTVVLSVFLNGRNLSRLSFRAHFPDQIFQGSPFDLELEVRNGKRRPAFQMTVVSETGGVRRAVGRLERGGAVEVTVPAVCLRRGRNVFAGLSVESGFPFGFFLGRKPVAGLEATAYPAVYEMYGRQGAPAGVREEAVSLPQRGVGDEFHGLHEYSGDEDARLINWKLTAKTGTPLVTEYSQPLGRKITLTADGTPGPETEARIAECASLARFYIDAGAEVRLLTDEGDIGFGRGLIHLDRLLNALALLGEGKEIRTTRGVPGKKREKRPRLVLFQSDWLLGLASVTTAVASLSLLLIEEMSAFTVLPLAAVIPLGRIFDRRRSHPLPKVLLDIAAVLYGLFFLFVDMPRSGTLRSVTRLVVFILVYLLLNPKRERQLRQLFLANFLVFFLVSGQAVSPLYFLFFLVYFLCAFLWLDKWQEERPSLRTSVRPTGVAALAAASLVCAAAMFVFMPRLYSPRMQQLLAYSGLSRFRTGLHSLEGLTGEVELGYFGPLRSNTTRALRASFLDARGRLSRPETVRIRAAAFDSFDGRRWTRSRKEFRYRLSDEALDSRNGYVRLRKRGGKIAFLDPPPSGSEFIEEFYVYPMAGAFVFSRGGIVALEAEGRSAFFDWTDTAYMPSMYAEAMSYRLRSGEEAPLFYRNIDDYDRILEEGYLQLPEENSDLRRLARRVLAGRDDARSKAEALESYFRGGYRYSSEPEHARQSVAEFLFQTRAGNCEYFATAMCLLLRQEGVPARLVIGFLSDDWNEYGRFFDVRQSDAHAWVEAFVPERGWLAFDPTPAESASGAAAGFLGAFFRRFRSYFNAAEVRWYRYVVGYDRFTQRSITGRLSLEIRRNLARLLIGLAALVGAVLVLRTAKPWRMLRARKRGRAGSAHFYYGLLNALEKKGFARRGPQTGKEFAEDVLARRPDLAPLRNVTEAFYAVRYAGRELGPAELAAAEHASRAVRHSLK
ncbi:MAG: DUF3488 domain-containing protein [Candidatus Aminicenantes bacterium]|nr:DUF3488 domain-containing protein [Candidatus Aminicenantes bacterium]